MNTPHTLFQPGRIPWDIVVNHQPTKLEVDAFAGGLGCYHYLCAVGVVEYAFRMQASVGHVAVANLHAAVNLGDIKAPTCEFVDQVVESVLVFSEYQQFSGGVFEDALVGNDVAEFV